MDLADERDDATPADIIHHTDGHHNIRCLALTYTGTEALESLRGRADLGVLSVSYDGRAARLADSVAAALLDTLTRDYGVTHACAWLRPRGAF